MRKIRDLSPENIKLLTRISRESKYYQVRDRAKCLLLSYQGFAIKELIRIFKVSRKTIYNWLTRWEDEKLPGLYNEKGRGRKAQFNKKEKKQIKEWVKEEPKALNKVKTRIENEWGIKTSKATIKRIIKKLNMVWKRMKRGLSKEADEWELEVKVPRLKELIEQEKRGEIDVRYLDQTGFSLTPYIPYGWQEKKERIILKSRQGKRINVCGLMNRKNKIYYEIIESSINSQNIISFLDKFSDDLEQKTVVILDQASIHTSDAIIAKLEEWKQKRLELFWLPTYSPKLNLIEILWKFIKYEWIETHAYTSQNNLVNYLKNVLDNFGKEYVINFA